MVLRTIPGWATVLFMRPMLSIFFCLAALSAMAAPPPVAGLPDPTAQELLDSVVAQMPDKPVRIEGRLAVHDRGQSVLRSYDVDIRLHFASNSVSGYYTLYDGLGASLEQFRVERHAGRPPHYEYLAGSSLKPAPVPDVFSMVRDTGVTWSDLSLPFLWWRNGKIAGSQSIRGRDCYVVDVSPPQGESRQPKVVRIWIDKKYRMLLRAEEYDGKANMLRRLSVDSFKKINEEWMIKDLAVEGSSSLPAGYKCVLTIRDMR